MVDKYAEEPEVIVVEPAARPGADPERFEDGTLSLVPYERTNRVPEALLLLEQETARALGVPTGQLVIIEGAVTSWGRAALFERKAAEGVEQVEDHVIVTWRDPFHSNRLKLALIGDREKALGRYRRVTGETP